MLFNMGSRPHRLVDDSLAEVEKHRPRQRQVKEVSCAER